MPETRVIISRRRLLASLAAADGTAIALRRVCAAKIVVLEVASNQSATRTA